MTARSSDDRVRDALGQRGALLGHRAQRREPPAQPAARGPSGSSSARSASRWSVSASRGAARSRPSSKRRSAHASSPRARRAAPIRLQNARSSSSCAAGIASRPCGHLDSDLREIADHLLRSREEVLRARDEPVDVVDVPLELGDEHWICVADLAFRRFDATPCRGPPSARASP